MLWPLVLDSAPKVRLGVRRTKTTRKTPQRLKAQLSAVQEAREWHADLGTCFDHMIYSNVFLASVFYYSKLNNFKTYRWYSFKIAYALYIKHIHILIRTIAAYLGWLKTELDNKLPYQENHTLNHVKSLPHRAHQIRERHGEHIYMQISSDPLSQ